jgi:hypothetical protein
VDGRGAGRRWVGREWPVLSTVVVAAGVSATLIGVFGLERVSAAPQEGDPILVGAGDIGTCSTKADTLTARKVDRVIRKARDRVTVYALGDTVYERGTIAEYRRCYDPTWGPFKKRTKPVPGNHEYRTPNASGYFSYFGNVAGKRHKGYYSYNRGRWHIVALNSNCKEVPGGCESDSPQIRWLRRDLSAHRSRCTLAYMHHPLFSSGEDGNFPYNAKVFWRVLYNRNADVVLAGHEHDYERFAKQNPNGKRRPKQGIRSFVAGTGGTEIDDPFRAAKPNTRIRFRKHGVLKLTLHPRSYSWRFIPVRGNKEFTDSGRGRCR